ncbi:MAG: hypothetical protein ACYC4R_13705 [Anaerolineae bacterium]
MDTQALLAWLLHEGGPAIRYRTAADLLPDTPVPAERDALEGALLQTETVQWLLAQMDAFGPITHVDIRVLNAIHGMKPTCLESVVARLLERGLRAGVPAFDARMERLRQYVDNPLVSATLDDPAHAGVESGRAVFIALVMASHLLRGGYRSDELRAFMERRVDALARLARTRNYAIHLRDDELSGLPKPWVGKPIIRPEMEPTTGATPLPLIHDLFALAYLPAAWLTEDVRHKVDQVVSYVLDARYRALPTGYGYLWAREKRTCYGCGWNFDLPDLGATGPGAQGKVVQRLELLARLPAARQAPWFQQGLRLLETYRTERGTYCFPSPYLQERKAGYYIGGEYMGLEEGRRTPQALELESTFHMLLLKRTLGEVGG